MIEAWRWVDPRVQKVRVDQARSYLLRSGWRFKPLPQPEVLVFEKSIKGFSEPIIQIVPSSEEFDDYQWRVVLLITTISALENRHPVDVLNDMLKEKTAAKPARGNGSLRAGKTKTTRAR